MTKPVTINISHRTIVFTAAFAALLWFAYSIRALFLIFFISFLIMSAINPLVTRLEKFRFPRVITSFILLALLMVGFFAGLASVLPPVVEQLQLLLSQLPELIEQSGIRVNDFDLPSLSTYIASASKNLLKLIAGTFSGFISLITTFFVSLYLLLERPKLNFHLRSLLGSQKMIQAEKILVKVEHILGCWTRGQIILCFSIGLLSYLGLTILAVPYALPLAIFAGLLELIPNLGPTIAFIPAVFIALTISPLHAAVTALLYIIIQQLENNLLVPQIMKKATGIHPLIAMFSILAGFRIAGIAGAVLFIPLFLILKEIFFNHFLQAKK